MMATKNHPLEVTKHALIIAIGEYKSPDWSDLSSVNDVPLIQNALKDQGFTEFTIIKDEDAVKERIAAEFAALAERVKPGDIVMVHFSSHGQQIMDNNRDELDGLDEAIVSYSAPAEYEAGYFGEEHIRDEELGEYLNLVRAQLKSKGEVLVLLDACHSGTGTRGDGKAKARGGKKAFVPPGFKAPVVKENTDVSIFESKPMTNDGNVKGLAPMVVISAARAHQLNWEYKGNGSLSLAFARSFKDLNGKMSYRSLFSKILKEMSIIAPSQDPAIEGDVDRIVLDGRVVVQELYYEIDNIDLDAISVKAGTLAGLEEGATVKVYPSGTISTKDKEPIANGVVTFGEMLHSNIILEKELKGDAKDYWVFIDQKSFPSVAMEVEIGNIPNKALRTKVEEFCADYALLNISEEPDFILKEYRGRLALERIQDSSIYAKYIPSEDNFRAFKKVIAAYAQGKFIKRVEFQNPDYAIDMKLVPVKMEGTKVVDTLWGQEYKDAGGIPSFSTTDKALILLTNNSSFSVYFNIVDIQPDGKINPVVPNPRKHENPKDFQLAPGQSKFIDKKYISFGPPYGLETFKVFASYEPINFGPIFLTGIATARGNFENEMEKLFADSYAMSRGVEVGTVSADVDACTFSYSFKIVKPLKN
jgi:hypothetical protein